MTEKRSSQLTLSESINLLKERQTHNDWLLFISPEGLKYLHLRYDEYADPSKPFKLMFKRSPEFKKYYEQIRNWFEDNKLVWKDITVDHKKYMATELSPDLQMIEQLILSVQNDLFKVSKTRISSPDSDLSIKLQGIKAPFIGLFCAFMMVICLVAYVLYQIVNLPNLGNPSLKALAWEEVFMIVAVPLGLYGLRLSGYMAGGYNKKTPKWKNPKIIFGRLFIIAMIFLGFCTY